MTDWPFNGTVSLRDYFAGLALAALLVDPNCSIVPTAAETYAQACAHFAYEYADAMMQERLKP